MSGCLATADAYGKVNVAIYSRPHFLDPDDDETPAFIMADRLSYANVEANPLKIVVGEPKEVSLCACKRTQTSPYCDGTHERSG